jgi:hypothetical protein
MAILSTYEQQGTCDRKILQPGISAGLMINK